MVESKQAFLESKGVYNFKIEYFPKSQKVATKFGFRLFLKVQASEKSEI